MFCCVLCLGTVLPAWFRFKYPHIAIGALASYAPILHFDNIVPLTSFYDAIYQDFEVMYALLPGNIIHKYCSTYTHLMQNKTGLNKKRLLDGTLWHKNDYSHLLHEITRQLRKVIRSG